LGPPKVATIPVSHAQGMIPGNKKIGAQPTHPSPSTPEWTPSFSVVGDVGDVIAHVFYRLSNVPAGRDGGLSGWSAVRPRNSRRCPSSATNECPRPRRRRTASVPRSTPAAPVWKKVRSARAPNRMTSMKKGWTARNGRRRLGPSYEPAKAHSTDMQRIVRMLEKPTSWTLAIDAKTMPLLSGWKQLIVGWPSFASDENFRVRHTLSMRFHSNQDNDVPFSRAIAPRTRLARPTHFCLCLPAVARCARGRRRPYIVTGCHCSIRNE
jgi:hypothetical protein